VAHTNQEWQELIGELRRMIDNPRTPKGKRDKAIRILDSITRTHGVTTSTAILQGPRREGVQTFHTTYPESGKIV
jgi:hypothetical protein